MRHPLQTVALAAMLLAAPAAMACGQTAGGATAAAGAPQSATASPLVCTTASPATKSLPRSARQTIETFLGVFDRGRRDEAKGWLAPETTLQIMGGLAPITRLVLVSLDHHY